MQPVLAQLDLPVLLEQLAVQEEQLVPLDLQAQWGPPEQEAVLDQLAQLAHKEPQAVQLEQLEYL